MQGAVRLLYLGVIQVPPPPSRLGAAQPCTTSANAAFSVIRNSFRRRRRRSRRETRSSAGTITARGSGDHHRIGPPSEYHGKIPRR